MKKEFYVGLMAVAAMAIFSCKKSDNTVVSQPERQVGKSITTDTLSGSVKGTMESGKSYYFASQVTINAGDTLLMQNGVKLLSLNPNAQLIVKGVFISLGTKDKPNWITGKDAYNNPGSYKLKTLQDPNTDPGLKPDGKLWGGIQCDTTAMLVDIKWTHLDFAGGTASADNPPVGYKSGDDLFVIHFQNANGYLILEDSWVYGSTTDAVRMNGGKFSIMRNTIEKLAYNDGDALNVKNSSVGDMAYNLIVGTAKGGTKASNKGTYGSAQTYVNMYNNTYISGGWRSVDPDRGANVNYEQGARGNAYNNIMVNCKTGLRILENPAADTLHCYYGNNLSYGDTISVVNDIYPVTHATHPQSTDIPNPSTFYPGYPDTYKLGEVYNAPALVGQNNPKFVNFPLPVTGVISLHNFVGDYDFHLASGSPAIGKGYTGFSPLNATNAISDPDLKATVTPPSIDLGAFPMDGSGNQH
ncbi:MAG TPA: hypothetical protein VIH57_08805 [Bacteroidales bacterium]